MGKRNPKKPTIFYDLLVILRQNYCLFYSMAGIYVHIPFCKSRCVYCGFYSTTMLPWRNRYVDAVCREMQLRAREWSSHSFSTVYLGGGTPSQLSVSQLERLFLHIINIYRVEEGAEITIECNPDDITDDFALGLRSLRINRVSMGVQTFSDARLRFLHRRHTASQVLLAVERLKRMGIDNISIDLMFGFPDETLAQWEEDIDSALSLDVQHLSAYSLMYEEGTLLYKMRCEQIASGHADVERDEELSVAMYEMLVDRLESAGFEHYEISNFAKRTPRRSFRSRHNSSYWQGVPYIGVGAAAHSYDIDTRQWNVADIRQYIKRISQGILPAEKEILTEELRYNDAITTALRTCEGISYTDLPEKFRSYLLQQAQKHIWQGLLVQADGHLRLTRKGLFISDSIMSDLVYV